MATPSLTENESAFMAAATKMAANSTFLDSFNIYDLGCYGYRVPEATARGTLGSLVAKGLVVSLGDGDEPGDEGAAALVVAD